jgi:serine protease Do
MPIFTRRFRERPLAVFLTLFYLALAGLPAACGDVRSAPAAQSPLPSFAPLVDKVMPAVVSIAVREKSGAAPDEQDDEDDSQSAPMPFDEFLRRFFGQHAPGTAPTPPTLRRIALGSGFIIDPAGYVVTDDHVIADAERVTVLFQDQSAHPARIVGRDELTDLALLKIDSATPLPYVGWGDSEAVRVGDWVMPIGNPFGLGGTVGFGIVSARGRDIHAGPYDDFLQIDASINRGNSGGPTFNLAGKVIGINTAIYTPTGGSVGVGFAIPANRAKPIIDELRAHGHIERGWLGVHIQEVTPELAKALHLPEPAGALVADVSPGGPAAKAGIRTGDVIRAFNGHPVDRVHDLPLLTAAAPIGSSATVDLWRNGQPLSLPVIVERLPEQSAAATPVPEPQQPKEVTALGLSLAPLTDALRRRLELPKGLKGVLVTGIDTDSPFAELDLAPGDVIQSIGHQAVTTPQQVAHQLAEAHGTALLLVNRQGTAHYVALTRRKPDGAG